MKPFRLLVCTLLLAVSAACSNPATHTSATALSQSEELHTLTRPIGVQWAWAAEGIIFSPSAYSPNMGGSQRTGPEGGDRLVKGISWQSTVKSGYHEVLLHLVASPVGNALGEEGEILLLSAHHNSNDHQSSIVLKEPPIRGRGILIPAGYVIWVYGEGGGLPHGAPVEVQTMIYMTDTN